MKPSPFTAVGDPSCRHRSHYECVACRKLVCSRCGTELAMSTDHWKTVGYWCSKCLDPKSSDMP